MMKQVVRSYWQAYREQRVLLLAMTIMIFVLGFALYEGLGRPVATDVIPVLLISPALFLMVSVSFIVSGEREVGTFDSLRLASVSSLNWLIGKLAWALSGAALQLLVMSTLFPLVALNGETAWKFVSSSTIFSMVVGWSEIIVFTLIATCLTRSIVRSLVLAILLIGLSNGILLVASSTLLNTGVSEWLGLEKFAELIGDKSLTYEGQVVWSQLLGLKLFWVGFWMVYSIVLFRRTISLGRNRETGRLPTSGSVELWASPKKPSSLRGLLSVTWQESRVHWPLALLLVGLIVAMYVVYRPVAFLGQSPMHGIGVIPGIAMLMFGSAIVGLAVPRLDLGERQAAFLEQLGIAPRRIQARRIALHGLLWLAFFFCWSFVSTQSTFHREINHLIEAAHDYTALGVVSLEWGSLALGGLFVFLISTCVSLLFERPIAAWFIAPLSTVVGTLFAGWWLLERGMQVDLLTPLVGIAVCGLLFSAWMPALLSSRVLLRQRWMLGIQVCLVIVALAGSNYFALLKEVPVTGSIQPVSLQRQIGSNRRDLAVEAARLLYQDEKDSLELLALVQEELSSRSGTTTSDANQEESEVEAEPTWDSERLQAVLKIVESVDLSRSRERKESRLIPYYFVRDAGVDADFTSLSTMRDSDKKEIATTLVAAVKQATANEPDAKRRADGLFKLVDLCDFYDRTFLFSNVPLQLETYQAIYELALDSRQDSELIEYLREELAQREPDATEVLALNYERLASVAFREQIDQLIPVRELQKYQLLQPLVDPAKRRLESESLYELVEVGIHLSFQLRNIFDYHRPMFLPAELDEAYWVLKNSDSRNRIDQRMTRLVEFHELKSIENEVLHRLRFTLASRRALELRLACLLYFERFGQWPSYQGELVAQGILRAAIESPYEQYGGGAKFYFVIDKSESPTGSPVIWTAAPELRPTVDNYESPPMRIPASVVIQDQEADRKQAQQLGRDYDQYVYALGERTLLTFDEAARLGMYWGLESAESNAGKQTFEYIYQTGLRND